MSGFKVILHLDLDAFYCQVEHKRLGIDRAVPLAVRQWEGLIAINYSARDAGVKRFMDIRAATTICPALKLIHVATIGRTPDGTIAEVEPNRASSKACLARYRRASFEVIKVIQKFSAVPVTSAGLPELICSLIEINFLFHRGEARRSLDLLLCALVGRPLLLLGIQLKTPFVWWWWNEREKKRNVLSI